MIRQTWFSRKQFFLMEVTVSKPWSTELAVRAFRWPPNNCLTGETRWCGGQEAFYLSPQSCPLTENKQEPTVTMTWEKWALMPPETWSHLYFSLWGHRGWGREEITDKKGSCKPTPTIWVLQMVMVYPLRLVLNFCLTATQAPFCELFIYNTPRIYYNIVSVLNVLNEALRIKKKKR